ncbi:unnamed protein product, partial [Linum tenue]
TISLPCLSPKKKSLFLVHRKGKRVGEERKKAGLNRKAESTRPKFPQNLDQSFGDLGNLAAQYQQWLTRADREMSFSYSMSDLVARTGRHQQRYEGGCRLVAGECDDNGDTNSGKVVEVLMINSTSGPGLLLPKGGWENDETVKEAAVREAIEEAGVRGDILDFIGDYHFKSKTNQEESCTEGLCRAAMFALYVKEELQSWPEQSTRTRSWLSVSEAVESCRHEWMEDALKHFATWLKDKDVN